MEKEKKTRSFDTYNTRGDPKNHINIFGRDKEIKTKFCSNCGEKIDAKAEICPKCGVSVKTPIAVVKSPEVKKALFGYIDWATKIFDFSMAVPG